MTRVPIPKETKNTIFTEVHHRCCICQEHRRASNIHHIDENPSNNNYDNLVALCSECHADVHTKSTMRSNITMDQIRYYKETWKRKCNDLENSMRFKTDIVSQFYYINVHRLESLFKNVTGKSMISNAPYRFKESPEYYNTLWHNSKSSLGWMEMVELREYFGACANYIMENCSAINLSLLEFNAYDPTENKGELIQFSCQLVGKDIPDQTELVKNNGLIEAPPGTMRREIESQEEDLIFETCMLLDNKYYFSDSAFIHFSEHGVWNGLGIVGSYRSGIGSNDGYKLRNQLIITPICIGVPISVLKSSEIMAEGYDVSDYNSLLI